MKETLTCPICGRKGLLVANNARNLAQRLIVHENEHYQHWAIGGHHFLTKTEKNLKEELELDLVLN